VTLAAESAPPVSAPAPGVGGAPPPDGTAALVQILGFIVPLGLVFYLLVWRPESKRRKERDQVLNSVKVKDKVVTVGGLHGTVMDIEKDEIVLLVDPRKDVRLRFRRSAVDVVESSGTDEKGDKK
jgi:preprotein translocase subunit YajC